MDGFVKIHHTVFNINAIRIVNFLQSEEKLIKMSIDTGKSDLFYINFYFDTYKIITKEDKDKFITILLKQKDMLDAFLLNGKYNCNNIFFDQNKMKQLLKDKL